jgi:hypothetical protein
MMDIVVSLTDTQYKGLQYIAEDPQEWIENAAVNRARIANDEIVKITVDYCLDNGIAIPATREEIVAYAFENDIVKTVIDRNAVESQANTA